MILELFFFLILFGFLYWLYVMFRPRYQCLDVDADFSAHVSVIIPCKGYSEDVGLLFKKLKSQSLTNISSLEIVLGVESKDDPCVLPFQSVFKNTSIPHKVAIDSSKKLLSGKMQNILVALHNISKRTDVVVFLDADGGISEDYICSLVTPLQDRRYMVSSTYRTHIGRTVGGLFISYWMELSKRFKEAVPGFVWGGGFAIRLKDIQKLHLEDVWKYSLSDDMVLSSLLNKGSYSIYHVKQYCVSYGKESLTKSFVWLRNQTWYSYIYNKSLFYTNLFLVLMVIIFCVVSFFYFHVLFVLPLFVFFVTFFLPFLLQKKSFREMFFYILLFPLFFLAISYSSLAPFFMRSIIWGQYRYTVDGNGRIISKDPIL